VKEAKVAGPVRGGSGHPFGAPTAGLEPRGYVMDEFLVEGTAGSYLPTAAPGLDGRWEVEPGEDADFRTRMYVVRPADPDRFNGIVLANWQNVTAGFDYGFPPREAYDGYAWVGITTQRVAIEGQPAPDPSFPGAAGLPATDPDRYGTLHHPGDAFSYDIFTAAAATVAPGRTLGDVDPLGGLHPRTILATGASQSAMRLGSYLNMVHARAQVFDGFLLTIHWGMCPPPPDQPLLESFMPRGNGLTGASSRIRDDGVPVLLLCSETECLSNDAVRQPDTDSFRFWEMAGTAHANSARTEAVAAGIEGTMQPPDTLRANAVEWEYVVDAAIRHLARWVEQGATPPRFPRIDVDGAAASIQRDEWDNATGGIRLPEVEAATARHRGDNDVDIVLSLFGESVPFSPDELTVRYPTRDAYFATWDGAIDRLLAAGLDIGPDVDALRARGRTIATGLFGAR
jgi:Alpha/beta hydrolase domain